MLITDEHLMENAKGNNHKEADKPERLWDAGQWCPTCEHNGYKHEGKAARTDEEPAEWKGKCLDDCPNWYVDACA